MKRRGHQIFLVYRDYGETLNLANEYGFNGFTYTSTPGRGLSKILNSPHDILKLVTYIWRINPDLILDFGIYGVIVGQLLDKPSLVFTDSEPSIKKIYEIQYRIFMPFVGCVVTPSFFRDDLGSKQVRVNSLKEMAYLSPEFFTPNSDTIRLLGLHEGERYVLLRFNDLAGVHDLGLNGFSLAKKIELVNEIEKNGLKCFISFEGNIPAELEKYRLDVPKNRIHDVLFFADLLVTDTQTMATEAAILGTPVIRCNSFVGSKDMGNFIELEHKYGLIYNFNNFNNAIAKAKELVVDKDLKNVWAKKRYIMLQEKIDITSYLIDFIENYSASFRNTK